MDLTEKHLIVIGGSSGMGLGVTKMALEYGAKVTIVGRTKSKLENAKANLPHKDKLNTISADITVEEDVIQLFETVGDFNYLVTTAADVTNAYSPVSELDIDSAKNVVNSKLIAAILLAKHGGTKIDRNGAFVFTSGIAAYRPSLSGSVISAVNGSLSALARSLSLELAPVRVNVISPGWVDTPIWDDVTESQQEKEKVLQKKAQQLPARKIGQPKDIALAALSLLKNEYITGTLLHVDGGQRLV